MKNAWLKELGLDLYLLCLTVYNSVLKSLFIYKLPLVTIDKAGDL